VSAPLDAPRNVYRGVPLAQRAATFDERLRHLRAKSNSIGARHHALWQRALAAPMDIAETWIHGDLHPRNVLVQGGRLSGVIDWGDIARGDAATDLAALWMVLPQPQGRRDAMATLASVSPSTWDRARGWALLFAAILLDAGLHDDARMAVIAERTLRNVLEGP
jgi:aminoglycoside phosphotransferase (APT) family kinase protein